MSISRTVSLAYDGAGINHVETVLPQLAAFGLVATFFTDPVNLLEFLPEWAGAVQNGHEVGNGSLFAAADHAGRLEGWSHDLISSDTLAAKELIEDLFPEQPEHSASIPWTEATERHNALFESVGSIYRYVKPGCTRGSSTRHASVFCEDITASQIILATERAMTRFSWVVLSFQGIGTGERSIDSCAHEEVCEWLRTTPGVEALPFIQASCRTSVVAPTKHRLL